MFYNPKVFRIKGIPVIVYPAEGLEKVLDRRNPNAIEEHLNSLYEANGFPEDSNYHVVALWREENDVMTDVWVFTKLGSWGSGPLADVNIFKGTQRETSIGVGSGNTLLMLGREEEHRRASESFGAYLDGPRPELPGLMLNEDF